MGDKLSRHVCYRCRIDNIGYQFEIDNIGYQVENDMDAQNKIHSSKSSSQMASYCCFACCTFYFLDDLFIKGKCRGKYVLQ